MKAPELEGQVGFCQTTDPLVNLSLGHGPHSLEIPFMDDVISQRGDAWFNTSQSDGPMRA